MVNVYLDALLRNQLASQIAPVLNRMNTAVNITAEVLSRKKATSAQTPSMMAKATGREMEARIHRFASSKARVLNTQTASMVTGHTTMKAKALTSPSTPGTLPAGMVTPTPNQMRLSSNDPKANA